MLDANCMSAKGNIILVNCPLAEMLIRVKDSRIWYGVWGAARVCVDYEKGCVW